jgi:hypothetical protein
MGRHVVLSLKGVGIERIVFAYEPVEPLLQIMTGGRIGIFLDQEAGGGVLHKECAKALLEGGFPDDTLHQVRELM